MFTLLNIFFDSYIPIENRAKDIAPPSSVRKVLHHSLGGTTFKLAWSERMTVIVGEEVAWDQTKKRRRCSRLGSVVGVKSPRNVTSLCELSLLCLVSPVHVLVVRACVNGPCRVLCCFNEIRTLTACAGFSSPVFSCIHIPFTYLFKISCRLTTP